MKINISILPVLFLLHTVSAAGLLLFTDPAGESCARNSCSAFVSPVEVMDVVWGRRLSEANPGLPDVLTAIDGLNVLRCVLEQRQEKLKLYVMMSTPL